MSIECNNTTPLGSRAGEELLKSTSDALQSAIIDLASLVPSDDPVENLNRDDIVDSTNALNNILNGLNLDAYPSLKDKFGSEDGIGFTDVAQYAMDNNVNVADLNNFLTEYNNNRPNSSGTDTTSDGLTGQDIANLGTTGAIGSGGTTSTIDTGSGASTVLDDSTNGISNNVSTSAGNEAGSDADTSGIPDTSDFRFGQPSTTSGATGATASTTSGATGATGGATASTFSNGPSSISGLESTGNTISSALGASALGLAAFANNVSKSKDSGFFTREQSLNILRGTLDPKNVILQNLLKDLDFGFAQNIGQNLTGSICGAYNDVLSDLTKAFAVVNDGKELLSNVRNLLEKDVKKLAESIKQKGILETLLDLLKKVIQGAVLAAKGVALAAVGSVVVLLKGLESAASAIMKKMNKVMRNINDYLKDATIQSIIADMEKLVVKMAESFERLTPENIANILFRLCEIARDLQSKLMEPALRLNRMANSIGREARAVRSVSASNTQQAVKYGAIRVSEEERQAKKKRGIGKYQKAAPSNREADYVAHPHPTESEISFISAVSESGLGGNITFSSAVVNEGDGAGWKEIKDDVYSKLLRIVDQTGESYVVKQGYKVRKKKSGRNKQVGAIAMNSHHSGYSVDITITESNRDDTIVAASRAGFTGIGVYSGHLHLDLAARRGWQEGYSGQRNVDIQALLDKHTIDGFKKKRS